MDNKTLRQESNNVSSATPGERRVKLRIFLLLEFWKETQEIRFQIEDLDLHIILRRHNTVLTSSEWGWSDSRP